MTTVQNIIDRAMRPMRDSALEFITQPELIEYVNEGVQDLATRELLFHKEASILTASNALAAPADLLAWRWITNAAGISGQWLDHDTFQQYDTEHDPTDDFFIVASWDDKAHIWPEVADGTSFLVGYFGLPDELDAVADVIPLSRSWDQKVVFYVRSRCYERLAEERLAATETERYEYGLTPPGQSAKRNSPGELAFAISLTTFDDDLDAKHR